MPEQCTIVLDLYQGDDLVRRIDIPSPHDIGPASEVYDVLYNAVLAIQGKLAIQKLPFLRLDCDCYPGCWADHSKDWPYRSDPDGSLRAIALGVLQRGDYVSMDAKLRVRSEELMQKVMKEVT